MDEYGPYRDAATPLTRTVTSGGVVRFSARTPGPAVHANAVHVSVGIRDVGINDRGHLVITHDAPGPVVSCWAVPDETLCARRVRFGISGGVGLSVVHTYSDVRGGLLDLRRQADWDLVRGAYSNLWIGWVHVIRPSKEN